MTCTKLLTFEQAAERINVQPDTVRKWAAAGKLPRCKIGGKTIRIPESAIEALIANSLIPAEPESWTKGPTPLAEQKAR